VDGPVGPGFVHDLIDLIYSYPRHTLVLSRRWTSPFFSVASPRSTLDSLIAHTLRIPARLFKFSFLSYKLSPSDQIKLLPPPFDPSLAFLHVTYSFGFTHHSHLSPSPGPCLGSRVLSPVRRLLVSPIFSRHTPAKIYEIINRTVPSVKIYQDDRRPIMHTSFPSIVVLISKCQCKLRVVKG
jgi:hypothetical protein